MRIHLVFGFGGVVDVRSKTCSIDKDVCVQLCFETETSIM